MAEATMTREERRRARRMKRFDNPWINPKLIWGAALLLGIIALGIIGRILWNLDLVFTGSAPGKFGIVSGMMVCISISQLLPTAREYVPPKSKLVDYSVYGGIFCMALSLLLFAYAGV